jgi:hypothetical protein
MLKMPNGREIDYSSTYQIRVRGHFEEKWSGSFDGFSVNAQPEGVSVLTGSVLDQASLYGLLNRLQHLGLPLLSVIRLKKPGELMKDQV